ncbi:MAG: CopG family transcriptional regulator [Candidatus Omnitrophica bacterium]|nr:CopG family transcriptional regulator [Candidatus Omnitrophota bacterium]
MSAAEFDQAFERGEGFEALDLESATVRAPTQRINIDIPRHLLHQIDNEAHRIGVPRTSVIKLWISEKLGDLHAAK